MTRLAHLDLFAGAGGSALGARAAGFTTVACVEHDGACAATLRAAGFPMVHADVRDVNYASAPYLHVDVLSASAPCQPFSRAQTRGPRGADDVARNGWPWLLAAAGVVRPRWLVAENVRGATPYVCATVLPALRQQFAYVQAFLLDAADYGAPQTRTRLFVVAGPAVVDPPQPHEGARATLGDVLRAHASRQPAQLTYTEGRAGTEPWRLDQPAPTVMTTEVKGTRASKKSNWTFHGGPDRASDAAFLATGRRRLTIAECAALQTFPADYPFQGTADARYRQIGNAVPPVLAQAVFAAVRRADRVIAG